MLPWKLLATASVPGDDSALELFQRGSEFSIRIGSYELMNSRVHGSEDALASIACSGLRSDARVLIGGLGMGFTLAAVLRELTPAGRVVVAELVPEVIAWHRGVLAAVSAGALRDRRADIRAVDVADVIRDSPGYYDAILLDVDNGPAALTSKRNDRLYTTAGLRTALAALRSGGVLAVWSSGPDPSFTRRLAQVGFQVEEVPVRGRGSAGGSRFLIWVARKS